jgi:hypothetical protein
MAIAERQQGSPRIDLLKKIRAQIEENKYSFYCPDDSWPTYGSKIVEYEKTFKNVLSGGKIGELLSKNSIVIDIMSPTDALIDLKNQNLSKKHISGIAVSLFDKRTLFRKLRERARGIRCISGDLMRGRTWREIEKKLNGKKATLIMERAAGGSLGLPADYKFYAGAAKRMWRMLDENGGILLLQVPFKNRLLSTKIEEWAEFLSRNGINIQYDLPYLSGGAIKITRDSNSPEELPFLR